MEFNKENLSKQVLDRLSKLDTLPNDGFLCGGAVANTILSLIDGIEYPINDLDVFLIEKENSFSNSPIRIDDNDIVGDRYENRIIVPANKFNYKIIRTENIGLINYVYVNFSFIPTKEFTIKEEYDIILNSFDINCCKVGIDLSTGDLHLNRDFTEFIRTRQLECVNPVTPAHSAIRILKKKDELKCYLNKEETFKYLSQFFLYDSNVCGNRVNLTIFFGKKYKELFHKYENELSEYFYLWTYAKTRKHYHKKINNSHIFSDVNKPKWLYSLINYIHPDIIDKWHEIKLWSLHPKKYSELDGELKKYHRPELGNNPTIIKRLWQLIYKQNKKQKNKSLRLLEVEELYPFVIINDNFHSCDFSEVNIEKLVKFIQENPSFAKIISISKLNFQESEKLMHTIKKLFPLEIEMFCDLISKEIADEAYFKPNFNKKMILERDYIENKFNAIKKILSKKLIDEIDLNEFEFKDIIKELTSPLDLLWAGKYMHNCLKGYDENGFDRRISDNKIRVFIISDDQERTALQISKSHSNTYKIDQVYGHSNTTVSNKHKLISDYLIKFLEYKHYLVESQKIIDDFKNSRNNLIDIINKTDYEKSVDKFKSMVIEPIIDALPIVDGPYDFGATIDGIDQRDINQYFNDEYDDVA